MFGKRCELRVEEQRRPRYGGSYCFKSWSHFPPIVNSKLVKPVALRPGLARLDTRPLPMGSLTFTNSTGIVFVFSMTAFAEGVLLASMRSGLRSISSRA